MTIYFANREPIDIAAIEVMGVNVKYSASPIGHFGTGLKFAIATALRAGQSISLARPDGLWRFAPIPEIIRGRSFARVNLIEPSGAARPLAFTTDLGRDWQLWMAFRELESNCRDEEGASGNVLPEGPWGTVFAIEGHAFEEVWKEREKVFLARDREPLWENENIQIFERTPADDPRSVFYRGVLAGALPRQGEFLYNVKGELVLTEDRTIQSMWSVAWWASEAIAQSAKPGLIRRALIAPKERWEAEALTNWPYHFSEEFDGVMRELRGDRRVNGAAYAHWSDLAQNAADRWPPAAVDDAMREQGEVAFALLRRLGVEMDWSKFTVTESLGEGVYGLAKRGKIYIARTCFAMGARFLASTLYEEHLHATLGLPDESRALQSFLFEKLFELVDTPRPAGSPSVLDQALRAADIMDASPKEIADDIPF